MRLVYIANARIPTEKAHGVQIMKMCEAFTAQGLEVVLVVPRRWNTIKTDPFVFYGISNPFKIVRLPIIDCYQWGRAGFMIGSLSFTVSSFFYGLYAKRRFSKEFSNEKGGLVFYSRDQDQFSFASFFFALKPYFFEVHGLKANGWLHRRLFKYISGVIATNSFIGNALVKDFPDLNGRVITLPNGVDLKAFKSLPSREQACAKLGLDPNKKNIVYSGHFYKWKGTDTLVKAAVDLSDDCKVHLIGGSDEDAARLKSECSEGSKRIDFRGHQPFTSMPIWYAAADILIITGTAKDADSVRYTSPIKLFEYLAAGKPIVAVDSPAVRDIVSGEEVYFYQPDSAESLTLNSPEESAQKIKKALFKATEYSWSKRAEKIVDFINARIKPRL